MENQVRIEFTYWGLNDSHFELNFSENDENMDLYRFHDFCKRFAAVMGYNSSTINTVFGPTHFNEIYN